MAKVTVSGNIPETFVYSLWLISFIYIYCYSISCLIKPSYSILIRIFAVARRRRRQTDQQPPTGCVCIDQYGNPLIVLSVHWVTEYLILWIHMLWLVRILNRLGFVGQSDSWKVQYLSMELTKFKIFIPHYYTFSHMFRAYPLKVILSLVGLYDNSRRE